MKWTRPDQGDQRVVRKFLWFPKRIGRMTRWLEMASWKETYCDTYGWKRSMPFRWEDIKDD